ncbi:PepSY-associated TM helix domain-containing protein [Gilvimarinus sp. F26214L]|uniref:PepSY-associated TM helix domain-containing protein n=1 Tax=Gilvimarinus sp. DZF01 TaxID=3461371 RepID=UPI0040457C98
MIRKVIFWAHLTAGVIAGLVVLMMSVTGVLLTYERQILAAADQGYEFQAGPGQARLSIDSLLAASKDQLDFEPGSITVRADPDTPVALRAGRASSALVNPYSGEILEPRNEGLANLFGTVTRLHRWFNLSGEARNTGRAITGASNLLFLFLIISGIYLWLPKIYRWSLFRLRLWFSKAPNSAARDFNWHHVFGIWAALPLVVIVATATVFNYSWANNLVYRLAGEEPPQRGGPPTASQPSTPAANANPLTLDELFRKASTQVESWQSLTLNLPTPGAATVSFSVDQGNGGQPQKRHSFTLDSETGELVEMIPFSSQTAGRQARSWVRFLHTGEALGIVGQTIAGLASFAGVIMVWTGLALALRRLARYRRRAAARRSTQARARTAGEAADER